MLLKESPFMNRNVACVVNIFLQNDEITVVI